MVAIIKRMRKLRALLAIRLGPGAAVLPPEVTRIQMDFARDLEDGHYGPRKFWRNCLPRLKYHNPAIPMTVNRTNDQSGPALLTIHFTNPSAAATKAGSAATERTEVINMKHRPESEILDQLLAITRARVVKPTAEESRQIQEIEDQNARSERDSVMMAEVNAKRKREEAIMIQARGDPDAMSS
ncbi:50S ribosomal protein-like protein Mrp49 [Leptodontidium sp. 2 PMI_412]|nr:50S ribosomal protein-like protein Mrp49 [Leptodontidium sp. 2 PMI_412]